MNTGYNTKLLCEVANGFGQRNIHDGLFKALRDGDKKIIKKFSQTDKRQISISHWLWVLVK